MASDSSAAYRQRVNRVLDYIDLNLTNPLTLEQLAEQAQFSTFHFHRIFKAIVGEALAQYIQRLRLERSAMRLLMQEQEPITNIALDCGFSSSSAFSRAFKEHAGVSPSQWRSEGSEQHSKMGITIRKNRKETHTEQQYGLHSFNNPRHERMETNTRTQKHEKTQTQSQEKLNVQVKDLAPMTVAYVRHLGAFKNDPNLFRTLMMKVVNWAAARNLLNEPNAKILAVYHDNPDITETEHQRTSVCVTVPSNIKVDGDFSKMTLQGGRYAIAHFELTQPEEFQQAWARLYGEWLPQSGYQPDDAPPFEEYLNNPAEHPEGLEIIDVYVPVKPM